MVQAAVLLAAVIALPVPVHAEDAPIAADWAKYRDRFVGDDGRVRDTGNNEVSHTEGQGWAMLFAESCDDRASFERIWAWTKEKMRRQNSALFSWRWDPSTENPIADTNNATDGDILIAWALARAARRWNAPEYRKEARPIVAEIRAKLIERVGGRLVLMPGTEGFKDKDGAVIVNPSYYVYPAFEEFSRLDRSPQWSRLRQDGLLLLARARFGQWGLPPDWITIGKGGVQPAANLPARFGFDAIRIPLYLIWGSEATTSRLAAELRFWNDFTDKPIPAWVDVKDGSLAPFPAPNGFQAVIQLARSWRAPKPPPLPSIDDKDDYYSASLVLLAGLARHATGH